MAISKERKTMQSRERHIRLLAQYACERVEEILSHAVPPRDLYDMTTWRLDRPDTLLEMVEGVLADPGFSEKWAAWQVFKVQLLEVAQPAWTDGYKACLRVTTGEDLTGLGMKSATHYDEDENRQMWFLEGWLAAMESEGQ
jgi:hypothetical protein